MIGVLILIEQDPQTDFRRFPAWLEIDITLPILEREMESRIYHYIENCGRFY
jgi:hypothetical protein